MRSPIYEKAFFYIVAQPSLRAFPSIIHLEMLTLLYKNVGCMHILYLGQCIPYGVFAQYAWSSESCTLHHNPYDAFRSIVYIL